MEIICVPDIQRWRVIEYKAEARRSWWIYEDTEYTGINYKYWFENF